MAKVVLVTDKPETTAMFKALSSEYRGRVLIGEVLQGKSFKLKLHGNELYYTA